MHAEASSPSWMDSLCFQDALCICMEEGEEKLAVLTSVFPPQMRTFKLDVLYSRIKAVILYHCNLA